MYTLDMAVRDYECDMQGIVNNAVYQHYFEHARHEYLKEQGFDFQAITQAGIYLVIYRAEIDYLVPLKSGDCFSVSVEMKEKSKTRCVFNQLILKNESECTRGQFFIAATNSQNKPVRLSRCGLAGLSD